MSDTDTMDELRTLIREMLEPIDISRAAGEGNWRLVAQIACGHLAESDDISQDDVNGLRGITAIMAKRLKAKKHKPRRT
jgi:hypothetical protein